MTLHDHIVRRLREAANLLHAAELRTCRGCGCDDDHACIGTGGSTCRWVLIDLDQPTGVCSTCAELCNYDQEAFLFMGRDAA